MRQPAGYRGSCVNRLTKEYRVFRACPHALRVLIVANMIFAFIMPVIDVFTAAYVMRQSNDVIQVVLYQLAFFTAIPAAFVLNGFLLRRLSIRSLYAMGMLLTGASLVTMMWGAGSTLAGVLASGLFLGAAYGLFSANRVLLALLVTTDANRNYFYGVEMFFATVAAVVVPLAVGWLIENSRTSLRGGRNEAYALIAAGACALALLAALWLYFGRFARPPLGRFVYLHFHPLWHGMLRMSVLKGLAQGYIVTAPAMLVLSLAGSEATLGLVQTAGGLLAALLLYGLGRLAAPRHRIAVFAAGLALFAIGAAFNAALFNAAGALLFVVSLLLAKPLLDLAYFPIQLSVIDTLSTLEQRPRFAYILSHEFGQYLGRVLGCGLFLVLARLISAVFALRFAMLAVALLQLLSIRLAHTTIAGARSAQVEAEACAAGAGGESSQYFQVSLDSKGEC